MTWRKLTRAHGAATPGEAVNVRITAAGFKVPHVVVRIPRSHAATAGIPPHEKSRVDVFIGEGADAGRMKIVHDPGDREHRAYPQGKAGALRIDFAPPAGAPAEFPRTEVEPVFPISGGIEFVLPWHKRAADRAVELPAFLKDMLDPSALAAVTGDAAPTVQEVAQEIMVDRSFAETVNEKPTPPTLDGIEEAARPKTNGVERLREPTRFPFTHKGETIHLEKNRHAVATALYRALGNRYVAGSVLLKAYGSKDLSELHLVMSEIGKELAPLRLEIGAKRGRGYWMREA